MWLTRCVLQGCNSLGMSSRNVIHEKWSPEMFTRRFVSNKCVSSGWGENPHRFISVAGKQCYLPADLLRSKLPVDHHFYPSSTCVPMFRYSSSPCRALTICIRVVSSAQTTRIAQCRFPPQFAFLRGHGAHEKRLAFLLRGSTHTWFCELFVAATARCFEREVLSDFLELYCSCVQVEIVIYD